MNTSTNVQHTVYQATPVWEINVDMITSSFSICFFFVYFLIFYGIMQSKVGQMNGGLP